MDREPAVAGRFYPGSKKALETAVREYIGETARAECAAGVIAPHAGYLYSGAVAGATYAEVLVPDRVVVLSPNHTGLGTSRQAVWPDGVWRLPVGDVPVDAELAAALMRRAPQVKPDVTAHVREHALEVQLPFLLARNPGVRVVPIVLADLALEDCEALGEAVVRAFQDVGAAPFVVASSDMSHYVPAAAARKLDQLALDRAVAVDAPGLYRAVVENDISMCGYLPATAMLAAARSCGVRSGKLVRYATSGDVSGDNHSVVGYAGVVVR